MWKIYWYLFLRWRSLLNNLFCFLYDCTLRSTCRSLPFFYILLFFLNKHVYFSSYLHLISTLHFQFSLRCPNFKTWMKTTCIFDKTVAGAIPLQKLLKIYRNVFLAVSFSLWCIRHNPDRTFSLWAFVLLGLCLESRSHPHLLLSTKLFLTYLLHTWTDDNQKDWRKLCNHENRLVPDPFLLSTDGIYYVLVCRKYFPFSVFTVRAALFSFIVFARLSGLRRFFNISKGFSLLKVASVVFQASTSKNKTENMYKVSWKVRGARIKKR